MGRETLPAKAQVEVGRERMKLLLKGALRLHIPMNMTYNESLPGN